MSEQKKFTTTIDWVDINESRPDASGNYLIAIQDGNIKIDFYDSTRLNDFATYTTVRLWAHIPVVDGLTEEFLKKQRAEYEAFLKKSQATNIPIESSYVVNYDHGNQSHERVASYSVRDLEDAFSMQQIRSVPNHRFNS